CLLAPAACEWSATNLHASPVACTGGRLADRSAGSGARRGGLWRPRSRRRARERRGAGIRAAGPASFGDTGVLGRANAAWERESLLRGPVSDGQLAARAAVRGAR